MTNLASVKHHNFFSIEYQNAELLSCNALHHSTIYRAKTVSHCKTFINLIYLHLYQITKYSFTYSQSIFAQLATESFSRTSKLYKRFTKPFQSNHWHCLQFPIIHLFVWQFPAATRFTYFLYWIFSIQHILTDQECNLIQTILSIWVTSISVDYIEANV